MPRPLPDHLIPTIKEVNDEETNQRSVVRPRNSVRDDRSGGPDGEGISQTFGGADLTETAPSRSQVGPEAPRGTVAPSGPHIVVHSCRRSEDGKVVGWASILDGGYEGDLDELREILCAALETLDAAVEDHHRARVWDKSRRVAYGDPITMQFIAGTKYIGGSGRAT